MLSSKNKFSSTDFKNKSLFQNSKKIYTKYGFFLLLSTNQNKKSVVLSKKYFKKAVDRNKYKRLFFNTLAHYLQENQNAQNVSLIFYPNKAFTKEELLLDLPKTVL